MAQEADETLAARIARSLGDRIISGELAPGTRLRQDHVAEEFGASHVPVREAFRKLEARGLAIIEPRRGARVAAFGLDEVREVADMRAALETLALRRAAPRLTPEILDRAEAATRAGDRSRDVREWEAANRTFHRSLIEPCAMPRLLAAIDELHDAGARFLLGAWNSGWETRTDLDHLAILQALRDGRVDDAVDALDRHTRWIGRRSLTTSSGAVRDAFAIVG